MFAVDKNGQVLAAKKMQGVTVLAKFKDTPAYLTIHLGGELRNSRAKQKAQNVVIVSDDGIGIKKLLLKQCQRYLSNCQIEAVFTPEQFQSVRDLMSIDMVISTMDTLDSPFPQIVIHSILSDEDIIRLIRFSKQGRLSETSNLSRELDKAIAQFVKEDSERNALKNKIKKIIR
nr:transcriptional regulator GutM [Streptococcus sp. X16XC17]